MKVVVCIKPVKSELIYACESRFEEYLMNPYDLYTLEKTLEMKKFIECEIICLCMGPIGAIGLLQKAIALGADQAILLNDELFRGSDTFSTSYILAEAIKKTGEVALVACGKQTIDGETGQVVYGIGERLKYYCLSDIEEITAAQPNSIQVKQAGESEYVIGNLKLPAVISFYDFLVSQPQLSLLELKRAKKKEIPVWKAGDLEIDASKCGINGSKTKVLYIQKEIIKKQKVYIEGNTKERAEQIYNLFADKIQDYPI